MKKLIVVLSVTLVTLMSHEVDATNVCGNVSGVWDSTGSPYYVTCDVTVPAGQMLEIGPGVQVLFTGPYKLDVYGNLQAIGTSEESITFTRHIAANPVKWGSIRFRGSSSSSSRLDYCMIEHSTSYGSGWRDGCGGGVACLTSSPTISHCTFFDCSGAGGGIYIDAAAPVISSCLFDSDTSFSSGWGQGGAIIVDNGSNASIWHCSFRNNYSDGRGGAIVVWASSATIKNCSFVGNAAARNPSGQGGGGIYVGSSSVGVVNCIFWGNNSPTGPQIHDQGTATVTYSDIQGGYSDTGNIDADPMFVDTANGDFHLQAGSPCIDTGDPSSPLDPDSTRADMGAFPYYHPCLKIEPDSLEFGLLDVGADSTMRVVLWNPTSQPIAVTDVSCSLPEFSFDTTDLNGQVEPFATYDLSVSLTLGAAGDYADTLVMVVQHECDTVIRIPMRGEAGVILPEVEGLVIQKGAGNEVQLDWQPVTHSISGQPLASVGYTIYGATTVQGPFVPFGYADTTTFVHPNILSSRSLYFYYVTADITSGRGRR